MLRKRLTYLQRVLLYVAFPWLLVIAAGIVVALAVGIGAAGLIEMAAAQ